jgi:CDP-glucose 4,6-dehydratase
MLQGWSGRRVFLTGHTGFKGGWLALWLSNIGAEVRGYALDPPTNVNFFDTTRLGELIDDVRGDIRDGLRLNQALSEFRPEIVFHLAAQPLVRASYVDPITTYETNVIGTARVLEGVRRTPSVRAVVSVTTDKCYENKEWIWGYRETDSLGGYDPYSSSKACAEMVSAAFRQSYFSGVKNDAPFVALATARAGNVIGGGDWSEDRLIPDLVRGFASGTPVSIRRPAAIRPWQHVLEPLAGYIILAQHLLSETPARYATAYNFGPADDDARTVSWIADHLAKKWGGEADWVQGADPGVHEAGYLKLDASRARAELGWAPRLPLGQALDWTVEWFRAQAAGEDMRSFTLDQIVRYSVMADV